MEDLSINVKRAYTMVYTRHYSSTCTIKRKIIKINESNARETLERWILEHKSLVDMLLNKTTKLKLPI